MRVQRGCFVDVFSLCPSLASSLITWIDSIKTQMVAFHWKAFPKQAPCPVMMYNESPLGKAYKVAFKDSGPLSSSVPGLFLPEVSVAAL